MFTAAFQKQLVLQSLRETSKVGLRGKLEYSSHGVRSAWRNPTLLLTTGVILECGAECDAFFQEAREETKKQRLEGHTTQTKIMSKPCGKASAKQVSPPRSRCRTGYRCDPRRNTSTQTSSSSSRPRRKSCGFFTTEGKLLLEDLNFEPLKEGKWEVVSPTASVLSHIHQAKAYVFSVTVSYLRRSSMWELSALEGRWVDNRKKRRIKDSKRHQR